MNTALSLKSSKYSSRDMNEHVYISNTLSSFEELILFWYLCSPLFDSLFSTWLHCLINRKLKSDFGTYLYMVCTEEKLLHMAFCIHCKMLWDFILCYYSNWSVNLGITVWFFFSISFSKRIQELVEYIKIRYSLFYVFISCGRY